MQTVFNSRSNSPITNSASTDRADRSIETLEFGSIWQAAQMLTGTLEFNEFIERFHRTILQHSGAQKCLLALPDPQDCWQFHSQSQADTHEIDSIDRPLADESDRPANIIYWVRNTQQTIVGNARTDIELPDRYLLDRQPASVLVLPLVKQQEVIGVVYLEHSQTAELFTTECQFILSLLCSQAAIALDNADRYRQARQAIERVRLQQSYLEAVLDNIPHMVWVKDRDGRLLVANRAYGEVSGRDLGDLIGKTDLDLFPADLAQKYIDDDLEIVASGQQRIVEEKICTAAGEPRWLETMKMPMCEGSEIVGTIGIALDITERKQAERELKLTQFAIDNSVDGIAWVRSDGSFTYGNQAMCQMLGYSLAEFTSLYVWDVDDNPFLSPAVWPEYWERTRTIGENSMETVVRTRHGDRCPIEISVSYLEFEGEEFNFVRVRDITERQAAHRERQQAELALRDSEARYHQIVSNIPAALYQVELTATGEYQLNYTSARFAELFELPVTDLISDISSLFALVIPEDCEGFGRSLPRTALPWLWEGRIATPTGKIKWIRGESHATTTDRGRIVWDGILTDITDRKLAEIALHESEERYHQLVSNIPAALFRSELTLDGCYQLNYASEQFFELFELSSEAVTGDITTLFDLVIPEDLESFHRSLPTTVLPWQWEGRIVTPTGKLKWIRGESHASATAEGSILWDGILTDITDRKLAEIAQRNSEQRYEQLVANVPVALYQFEITAEGKQQLNYVSPRFYEMFEAAPDPAWENILLSLDGVHPDDRESFANTVTTAVATGKGWVWEGRMFTVTGQLKWIRGESIPIIKQDGKQMWDGMLIDITDRKLAEIALQESEARHQKLADNLPGVIYQLRMESDGSLKCLYMSSGCWDLFETSPASVTAEVGAIMQYLHPDDSAAIYQAIVHSAHTLSPKSLEGRFILPSGQIKWVKSVSRPERQPDGSIVWDGMMLDITDRKQAESELLASKQFLQTVLDSFPLYIFWKDRQSNYLGGNHQFALSTGASCSAELIGKTDYDMPWNREQADAYRADDRLVIDNEIAKLGIIENQQQLDGSQIWLETNKVPLRNADGEVIGVVGAYFDVTDRQQAQLELAASRQKNYNLIQSVNGVVWEYDLTADRFTFASDRAADLLGYPVAEWLKENFWQQHVHPDDLDRAIAIHDEAQKHHRNCELEYRMLDARGQEIWVYDICTLTYDPEQQAIASSGVLFDISDRKQVETELQHSNERLAATNAALQKATQLKDEFLATMSHELRTPLNAILGMSEALQEQVFGDLNADQIKSIETIERGGKHLLSLINDILDVSKISAGKVELELSSISVANFCNSSLAFIRQQARQKQIQIDLHLPPHHDTICVDERRMRQVAINLLGNAVKFTPNGGRIELAVSVCESMGAWYWEFAVRDTGIGIAPADLDRLFQPFTQLDSKLNRQYEGTGLGLTLAKQIVELHGGTLDVESELDRGSCFTVRLPHLCDLGGESVSPTASSGNLSPSASMPMVAAQILIAEDNLANYHTLNSYLQAKGYRTLWAENGVFALRILEECIAAGKLPDLVLMDIQMPEMDGIEAIDRIRNQLHLSDLPIIALTALAMSGDRDRCLAAGANDYLPKPVKLKQLHTTIQQLIREVGD